MRRILCAAMAAIILISLAACGEEPPRQDSTAAATEAVTEATVMTEQPTDTPAKGDHDVLSLEFINTFDKKPAIEEQSVYEKGGLTIKAKEIRYDTVNGAQIMLGVRNDSGKELLIQNNYTVVNGFMIKPEIEIKIAPRKKAEMPISLPYLSLALADIHSLREMMLSLRIMDSKTFEVVDTTDAVKLSLKGTIKQTAEYDATGKVAYNDKGVKIILQGVKRDTLFNCDSVVKVYMENNTNRTVAVQNKKLTVNGYDITATMTTMLLPGKRAVDVIELFDSELDEHGVTSLDSVDVAFEINDYEKWETVAATKSVSVELPTAPPTESHTDETMIETTADTTE